MLNSFLARQNKMPEVVSNVSFCSSLKDDAWLGITGPGAFESWHFDAVSDNGREVLVIDFYDNYALSPRFLTSTDKMNESEHDFASFPAVSMVYSVDGRTILSAVNEFGPDDITASIEKPNLAIGGSSLRFSKAEYGSGFVVTVDARTLGGKRIRAELEWLMIESNLAPLADHSTDAVWNMASPRADVTGRITLLGRRGNTKKTIHFRGTGYHDHITSRKFHYRDLTSRMWGRAHFVDATVVFERHGGVQDASAPGKFFMVRDGCIHERNAACQAREHKRDRFGLMIPRRVSYVSDDNIKIRVKPLTLIRSGFFEVKMLSEVTLGLRDGRPRKSMGITEFVDPRRMRSKLIRWMSDLRIGRKGRSPFLRS